MVDANLQVVTENGIVQGFQKKLDNGPFMYAYTGIPFAKPPLYSLRFMSPQPHDNWSGVLNATLPTPACVEFSLRLVGLTVSGSEDCLYLNVYSPQRPQIDANLPVLFWIYGGAFLEGNTTIYHPDYLIEENIIVVTSNYRLGIFGRRFLSTQDEAAPGNYGLKDQNAALKWVNNNIRYFGGDASRVTIMGESAGACSTMYHMLSPKSRGLFHAAAVMSGDTLTPWCSQRHPRKVAKDISIHLGVSMDNSTSFIEALRRMDSETLMRGQITPILVNSIELYHNGFIFTPVIEHDHEDAFITQSSYSLLETGKFARVPLMIGTTSLEFNFFSAAISVIKPLLVLLDLSPSLIPSGMDIPPSQKRFVGSEIRRKYFRSDSLLSGTDAELLQYLSDVFFVKSLQKSVQLLAKYIPVFNYVFDYDGQGAIDFSYKRFQLKKEVEKGTGHFEDMVYMWKVCELNEQDKLVSKRFVKMLSNFAKCGNPTPVMDDILQNVIWPPVNSSDYREYLLIGNDLKILQNYRNSYMEFWDELYEKYCRKPFTTY
ncbi:hypothetical protein NQ315_009416 [Exocentrus adspersus]|uniref:Carboxylic ester hydrolase n=1 Tax=Exocentrus adspersus TaxID=1586481 RepID=A0AAV8WGL0_9CUCU|nr:hypothetical protein NQ315_009416 [Exocentrus adspersus]